ncbi:MAG: hypothetical protein WBM32_01715 [Crocosphaera sp.]|jgi:hypothetical protein
MPNVPGINHQRAIKAFEKAGFQIIQFQLVGVLTNYINSIFN